MQMRTPVEDIFAPTSCRVKDKEKASAFGIIQRHAPISQKQILDSYPMRPGDVSGAIKELLADGLIRQTPNQWNTGPGRPEIFFEPCNDRLVCLAIYTDSWIFRAAAIDLAGNPIFETHLPVSPEQDADSLYAAQCKLVESVQAQLPAYTEILGIGLSLPGNVDSGNLIWRDSRRWPNVRGMGYRKLQSRYDIPVALSRDLDAALASELMRNDELTDELVVLVHWGIGFGIGFSAHGTIVTSNHGRFGTLGYMQLAPENRDHVTNPDVERLTSLRTLIPDFRDRYPNLPLDERAVARIVATDDLAHIPSFAEAIECVGMMMRNICMIFYPDRILLLSPFVENPRILEQVRRSFKSGRMIDDLQHRTLLEPVDRGYRGCMFGATQQLFAEHLPSYLKARY